jgi:hypothetical protein
MLDSLSIINKVIEEHQIIRRHIKLIGDRLPDQEALRSLEKAQADLIPGRLEVLSEKQGKLQQTLSLVDEGLKNHFTFEEETLPPLLGKLLMQGLILEHKNIQSEISKTKTLVADTKLEGLKREELLSQELNLQQTVRGICHLIEEHSTKEEAILRMIQKALAKTKKGKNPS